MRILIINQPLNNRGDESAHKALVRRLVKEFPQSEITVLFTDSNKSNSVEQFNVRIPQVTYVQHHLDYNMFLYQSIKLGMYYKQRYLWEINPQIRAWLDYFKKSDLVICAPGGICMGGFQDWMHLFNLECAKFCKKPLVYYGRSFGPFPTKTLRNRQFKRCSMEMLRYFSFLSIRDLKTQALADQLGIPYVPVADTAFLDCPVAEIPEVISSKIAGRDYFVFVPNLLIWHFAYSGTVTKEEIIQMYCKMLKEMFVIYPNHLCVMLPQTFGYKNPDPNDVNLFLAIKQKMEDERIVVTEDVHSSDIQQTIIRKSAFVVGARYHSIVFAINNNVPFVALSYEHKIAGLLSMLGKENCMVDIEELVKSPEGRESIVAQVSKLLPLMSPDAIAQKTAKDLTERGFDQFRQTCCNNC